MFPRLDSIKLCIVYLYITFTLIQWLLVTRKLETMSEILYVSNILNKLQVQFKPNICPINENIR